MENLKSLQTKIAAIENKYAGIISIDYADNCIYLYIEKKKMEVCDD